MRRFAFALSCLAAFSAHADGLPLKNGRYDGPALVLKLTKDQIRVIDHYRTCHRENFKTMNAYTPYVFILTPSQKKALKAKKGFAPRTLEVYETYRGFNDAGPHWNLALRFAENEIEIPLKLVISDREAHEAHEMQGWKSSNPCFPELAKHVAQPGAAVDAR